MLKNNENRHKYFEIRSKQPVGSEQVPQRMQPVKNALILLHANHINTFLLKAKVDLVLKVNAHMIDNIRPKKFAFRRLTPRIQLCLFCYHGFMRATTLLLC